MAARLRAQAAAVEAYVTGDGLDSRVGAILDSSCERRPERGRLLRHRRPHSQSSGEPITRRQRAARHRTSDAIENHAAAAPCPAIRRQGAKSSLRRLRERRTGPDQVKGQLSNYHKARTGDAAAAAAASPRHSKPRAAARAAAGRRRAEAARGAAKRKKPTDAKARQKRRRGQRDRWCRTRRGPRRLALRAGDRRGSAWIRHDPGSGRYQPSRPRGGRGGGVLPGRALCLGRFQPPGRRLLGTHDGRLDAAGVDLLHGATIQDQESTPVNLLDIEPGDLLFYHFPNDGPLPITHVAIYVGSGPYGTNTIIQAAQVGTNVAYYPMYWGGFVSAGRP